MTSKNTTKGFTLIELLVVIAIIGILSSVVLASLTNARDKAKFARYQSDLRQAELFFELYNLEYGGYPAGNSGTLYCIADSSATEQCMIGGTTTGIVNITQAGGGTTITAYNNESQNINNLAAVAAPKLRNDITLGTGTSAHRGILYQPCTSPTTVDGRSVCIVTDPDATGNPQLIFPTQSNGSTVIKTKVVGINTVSDYVAP